MSRGLGEMERGLLGLIKGHAKPVTFAEITRYCPKTKTAEQLLKEFGVEFQEESAALPLTSQQGAELVRQLQIYCRCG